MRQFDPITAVRRKSTPTSVRRHVLYVEDEDLNWSLAERKLRDGYVLTRARNAQEAFDHLRQTTFDAILMDIQLKGSSLDGIQLTRVLKDQVQGPELGFRPDDVPPIIFVTAYTARYGREELCNYGGDEVIPKPVNFVQLNLSLARLIARRIRLSYSDPRPARVV